MKPNRRRESQGQQYDPLVGARIGALTGGLSGLFIGTAAIGRYGALTLLVGAVVGGAVGYRAAKRER